MKLKVSVIIPTYNVCEYITKCLNSVLSQTYKNIEIIVIDDCSLDNTYSIVKKYEKENIKVYKNKSNKGLSHTRNFGIEKSTGDLISFIDSDDFVPNNFIEELVKSIEENKSDIAVCDINYISNINILKKCGGDTEEKIINNPLAASACNKIFSKKLFKDNYFPINKINEDIAVIIPLLINNKISYTEKTYYNYVQRVSSIQNSAISFKRFDIFESVNLALTKIDNSYYRESIIFNQLILFHIYVLIKIPHFSKRYKYLKEYHKKYKVIEKKNSFFNKFLFQQSKILKTYYRVLYSLNNLNFIFLENIVIGAHNLYKRYKRITKHVDINKLKKIAYYQNKLPDMKIKISVIVPNYNYANYLLDRIYSILNQNYKVYELIILDDASTDQSNKVINEIVASIGSFINIKAIYNKRNSGSAFKQWEKGFLNAKGDYVWIAEADDYCDKDFLRKLTKSIEKDTIIAYSNTAYINSSGEKIVSSIFKAIDLNKSGHWRKSYKISGEQEFKKYAYLNCTIPNVSSAIIKNGEYKQEFEIIKQYKQAGDWLFYSMLMHKGNISFVKETFNYYREHGNNISSTFKKTKHLEEIKQIHDYFRTYYSLNSMQEQKISERLDFLRKEWNI